MALFFIISGLVIMFFGILGMIILPSFLLRIHASTKCGVTGAVSILVGFTIYSGQWELIIRLLLIIVFLLFTAPLVAHILGVYHVDKENSKDYINDRN